jgi:aminoglycoside phosphotransferase (APT) family kinase protein
MKIRDLKINWKTKTQDFQNWLEAHMESNAKPLSPGVEADVFSVGLDESPNYVFKRWKSGFRHNPQEQFDFLNTAKSVNLPVTRPVGWGRDASGRGILATEYGGKPVQHPSQEQLEFISSTLAAIHNTPIQFFQLHEPKDNLVFISELFARRFPHLHKHPDIHRITEMLRKTVPVANFSLIHGDFNLGNILFKGDRLSVIDWTDAQIGDYRYDLAWSSFLLWIYGNEQLQSIFFDSYLNARDIMVDPTEYNFFELVAGLRWILIRRQFPVGGELENAYRYVNSKLMDRGYEKVF